MAEPSVWIASLEKLLAAIRGARGALAGFDGWDRWGREHADAAYVAEMEADQRRCRAEHDTSVRALASLVSRLRVELPEGLEAWAAAREAYLAAGAAVSRDEMAVFMSERERRQWQEFARRERDLVEEHTVFTDDGDRDRYRAVFGFDPF
jgi:hypothetical protein